MSDVFAPQPVKTKSAGDVAAKISDATTPSQQLAVDSGGNASTNLGKVGGTATDTNSGNKSAGTQRVVLATDQPQLTNALKVDGSAVTQPISGNLTGNQATNVAQINGVTPLMGAGNGGTGSLRVNIATDQATVPVSFGNSGTVTDDYNTSAALAAGATVTLDSTNIGSGTGHLAEATVSSSVAIKAQLGTWDGTTFTVKRTFFVAANTPLVYTPSRNDEITKATGATAKFRWSITNEDNANAADVYCSTTYWN